MLSFSRILLFELEEWDDFLNGFQWWWCPFEVEFFPPPFEFDLVEPLVTLLAGDELSSSFGDIVDKEGMAALTPINKICLQNSQLFVYIMTSLYLKNDRKCC